MCILQPMAWAPPHPMFGWGTRSCSALWLLLEMCAILLCGKEFILQSGRKMLPRKWHCEISVLWLFLSLNWGSALHLCGLDREELQGFYGQSIQIAHHLESSSCDRPNSCHSLNWCCTPSRDHHKYYSAVNASLAWVSYCIWIIIPPARKVCCILAGVASQSNLSDLWYQASGYWVLCITRKSNWQ